MIQIESLKQASDEAIADINVLLPQLESADERTATLEELEKIVRDESVVLVVAKDDKKIIGMATLYVMTKFGKRIAHVEDVVVDYSYRGQGLGEKIMRTIIDIATKEKVGTLSLTSRPSRIAGNKLYRKLGFEQKETNVFRMKF